MDDLLSEFVFKQACHGVRRRGDEKVRDMVSRWMKLVGNALQDFMGSSATAVIMFSIGKFQGKFICDHISHLKLSNKDLVSNALKLIESVGVCKVDKAIINDESGIIELTNNLDNDNSKPIGGFYLKGLVVTIVEQIFGRDTVVKTDVDELKVVVEWKVRS